MAAITELLLRPPSAWPASVWAVLLAGLATLAVQVFWRPSIPKNAPKWFREGDWPIAGALRFYSARSDFFRNAMKHSPTGNFSFYIGKKQVVGLSGPEGRKVFFENRELGFSEGFSELFTGQPVNKTDLANFSAFFQKSLLGMLKRENFVRNLHLLTGDTRRACETLASSAPSPSSSSWQVTNPFDSLYRIVYQLTMRTVGADDIAADPALLGDTLALFERFETSGSTLKVVLPWFPAPAHLWRLWTGARIAMVIKRIVDGRRRTGKRGSDALQYLIDQGVGIKEIVSFQIGALFAGQVNSGIHAAWIQVHLSLNAEWKARVQADIDASIARHRPSSSASASIADVLSGLAIEDWESEFPSVDLCLRESIRLGLPGTGFRKNVSGRDIPIGATGEVIPHGAFAAYLMDDVSKNEAMYAEPDRFDPGRYLDGRAEDRKVHHGYVGWGSGRHPCLGMKFAKLEITIITVYFNALFDYELSDAAGNPTNEVPQFVHRNQIQSEKPKKPVYLRYRAKEGAF
ncbi:hypothetical protein SLS62_010891 [Diatrype stigma]|uniref:Cytochrome P450 n=1 Tax=Diatrype stigma TaxID=117547 RepID=A0AAN9UA08_9PEZI